MTSLLLQCTPESQSAVLQHELLLVLVHRLQTHLERLSDKVFEGDTVKIGVQVLRDQVAEVASVLGRVLPQYVPRLVV